jgi:hypothetical protein
MRPANPGEQAKYPRRGSQREAHESPYTGNLLRRPAATWAGMYSLSEGCGRVFPAGSLADRTNVEASTCVLGGMRNLSVRCGQDEDPKPRSGNHAASRRLVPLPGRTTRREDHAALIVLDEFRTGYSSAGCSPALPASASPARSNYHAFSKGPLPPGHFYFARMRTFLLCLDSKENCTCRALFRGVESA